jgi:hypothetical protein
MSRYKTTNIRIRGRKPMSESWPPAAWAYAGEISTKALLRTEGVVIRLLQVSHLVYLR